MPRPLRLPSRPRPLPRGSGAAGIPSIGGVRPSAAGAASVPLRAPVPATPAEGWTPSSLKKVGQSDKIADEIVRRRRGRRGRRRERGGRHLGPEHDLRLPGEGERRPPVHADLPRDPEPFPERRSDRPRRGREEGPGRHQPRGGPDGLLRPPAEGGRVRRRRPAPSRTTWWSCGSGTARPSSRPAPGVQRAVPGEDLRDEMGREGAVGRGSASREHRDPPRLGRRGVQPLRRGRPRRRGGGCTWTWRRNSGSSTPTGKASTSRRTISGRRRTRFEYGDVQSAGRTVPRCFPSARRRG